MNPVPTLDQAAEAKKEQAAWCRKQPASADGGRGTERPGTRSQGKCSLCHRGSPGRLGTGSPAASSALQTLPLPPARSRAEPALAAPLPARRGRPSAGPRPRGDAASRPPAAGGSKGGPLNPGASPPDGPRSPITRGLEVAPHVTCSHLPHTAAGGLADDPGEAATNERDRGQGTTPLEQRPHLCSTDPGPAAHPALGSPPPRPRGPCVRSCPGWCRPPSPTDRRGRLSPP